MINSHSYNGYCFIIVLLHDLQSLGCSFIGSNSLVYTVPHMCSKSFLLALIIFHIFIIPYFRIFLLIILYFYLASTAEGIVIFCLFPVLSRHM
jgi:hypothetical protein